MKRKGKVFIDANILIHAASYQSADVFQWINELYEEIYIHKVVLDELRISSVRQKVEMYIKQGAWYTFDPDDEETLPDDLFAIYEGYMGDMRQAFEDLDQKKVKESRSLKHTNDLGEMHCLAAAMLIGASIICSNDYDIKEVIEDASIKVTSNEESESIFIEQDTLVDFCYYVIRKEIASRSVARKFLKATQPGKVSNLDERL